MSRALELARRGEVDHAGGPDMAKSIKRIETVEEFEDAKKRVAELSATRGGSSEAAELNALIEAIEKWQLDHGDIPQTIKAHAT